MAAAGIEYVPCMQPVRPSKVGIGIPLSLNAIGPTSQVYQRTSGCVRRTTPTATPCSCTSGSTPSHRTSHCTDARPRIQAPPRNRPLRTSRRAIRMYGLDVEKLMSFSWAFPGKVGSITSYSNPRRWILGVPTSTTGLANWIFLSIQRTKL